jgi:hypothetical protein
MFYQHREDREIKNFISLWCRRTGSAYISIN